MIDVILDRRHPQADFIHSSVTAGGGIVFLGDAAELQPAINVGQGEWIVLVDRRATVTPADFKTLPDYLRYAETPVWLQPSAISSDAERFIGETCPPSVALCWSNPALFSLVCVRRSELATLPEINSRHPDAIWEWLIRAAGRPHPALDTTEVKVGDWVLRFESAVSKGARSQTRVDIQSTRRISQPHEMSGPPSSIAPGADSIPGLICRHPAAEVSWLIKHIEQTKPSLFVPDSGNVSVADTVAVKAGLLLWHDAADASHQLSQSIEGLGQHQAGDYWHAILHRREPDYGNAKYWFRQFRSHPVMAEIVPYATRALQDVAAGQTWKTRLLSQGHWDPMAFVDLCEACAGDVNAPLAVAARRIQAAEMQLLMAATYRDASGKA